MTVLLSSFTFNTSSSERCLECGDWFNESEIANHDCVAGDGVRREHLFRHISTDNEIVVSAKTRNGAWRRIADVADDVRGYFYYGHLRSESSKPIEVGSAFVARTGEPLVADED